jgi:predicted DNA-binding protein
MEVHFTPELEKQLTDLSAQTGRPADELVQDVMAGYVHELAGVRATLDSRYDEIKSGRVKLIDGEEFFEGLRQREEALLKLQPR